MALSIKGKNSFGILEMVAPTTKPLELLTDERIFSSGARSPSNISNNSYILNFGKKMQPVYLFPNKVDGTANNTGIGMNYKTAANNLAIVPAAYSTSSGISAIFGKNYFKDIVPSNCFIWMPEQDNLEVEIALGWQTELRWEGYTATNAPQHYDEDFLVYKDPRTYKKLAKVTSTKDVTLTGLTPNEPILALINARISYQKNKTNYYEAFSYGSRITIKDDNHQSYPKNGESLILGYYNKNIYPTFAYIVPLEDQLTLNVNTLDTSSGVGDPGVSFYQAIDE